MELILAFALAGAITTIGIVALLKFPGVGQFMDTTDKPNAMHVTPVPRIGGMAMFAAIFLLAVCAMVIRPQWTALNVAMMLAAGLAALSARDDRTSLSPQFRLCAHMAAALLVVFFAENFHPTGTPMGSEQTWIVHPLGMVFLVLVVVWMTNLYNFMDGANGLAGFMGVIGFGALAIAGQSAAPQIDSAALTTVCAAIAGACLGFLFFNFPKARVFMGDAGSIPLGFLAAALGLYGALNSIWPGWLPVLVFSPFIVDATVTLARRLLRRERVWEPHRQHYYHRLILCLGWSHTRTTLAYGLVMGLAALHAVLTFMTNWSPLSDRGATALPPFHVGAWVLIYALLLIGLERRFSKKKNKSSNKKNEI